VESTTGNDSTALNAVWDYTQGNSFYIPEMPVDGANIPLDFFCCGQSLLANGNLLVAGGMLNFNASKGPPYAAIFNTATQNWVVQNPMTYGRWYPTLTLLGDGRVFTISGRDHNGVMAPYLEIFTPTSGWTLYPQKPAYTFPMYASLFLMQDGRLFYPGRSHTAVAKPKLVTVPTSTATTIAVQDVPGLLLETDACDQGTSVMLGPVQDQTVMIMGGANKSGVGTSRVGIFNLKSGVPTYAAAAPLHYGRVQHQAVLLPDRTVFVCGGSALKSKTYTATLTGEIYNPQTQTWTDAATSTLPRMYHSIALLLPDGRVLIAGSNPGRSYDYRLELYSPPYLFKGARPTIQSVPTEITYGQTISITTPQASSIRWASLVRPSSTTHCLDTEQRIVDVPFSVNSNQTGLNGQIITNPNLAPPGWYMLFLTNTDNIPSEAAWVHLT
jgi:hypothetical protein